jgi:hypothetical protein
MSNFDRHATINAGWIAAIAIGAIIMAAPPYWEFSRQTIGVFFWAGIGVLLCSVLALIIGLLHKRGIGKPMSWPFLVMSFGIIITCGGAAWHFWPIKPLDEAGSHASVTDERLENITLEFLWKTDRFSASYHIIQILPTDLYSNDAFRLGQFNIGVGIYGNFDSKSLVMSLYVPGSDRGYDIIHAFGNQYSQYLDAAMHVHVWAEQKGDHSQPISDDLTFTKRIYIYHDNIYTDKQIHTLESYYRSKGIEPVFRGFGYLGYRKLRISSGQEPFPVENPVQANNQLPGNKPPPGIPMHLIPIPLIIGADKVPSILSLFMTDFRGTGGMAAAWADLQLGDGTNIYIYI